MSNKTPRVRTRPCRGKSQEHERGQFVNVVADNGFYQGAAEDKNELIRVKCSVDEGYYPTLSGNKYRYALRFMLFSPQEGQSGAVESSIQFRLAAC